MQLEVGVLDMRVLVDVINTVGIERTGSALDTVAGIAFFQQKFGKVGAVLTGDPGD